MESRIYLRIPQSGYYPLFIQNKSLLEEKLVEKPHIQTIHRGMTLTMAKQEDKYCIPTLR